VGLCSAALRLTNREQQYSHLSFVPGNTRIIFTASDDAGTHVYEVPALGGEPRIPHRGASRRGVARRPLARVRADAPASVAARRRRFRTVAPRWWTSPA
jgi:hypothetical protein